MTLSPQIRNLLAAFIVLLFGAGVVGALVVDDGDDGTHVAQPSSSTTPSPSSTESPTSLSTDTTLTSTTLTATTLTPTTFAGATTTTTQAGSGLGAGGTGSAADGADGTATTGGEWMLIPGLLTAAAGYATRKLRAAVSVSEG